MRLNPSLVAVISFTLLVSAGCGKSSGEGFADDKMVGDVKERTLSDDKIHVNISDWEKRDRGPVVTAEGYEYAATVTDTTSIKHENGTKASIDDIKTGQKVQVNPPREDSFEGNPKEIILLEMTYEEKYESLLAHSKGDYNITVMNGPGGKVPDEMGEGMYEKVLSHSKKKNVVAGWGMYDPAYVVDYKKELNIQHFPVILVFDDKELLFKTYNTDELYAFFEGK